jgi:hypothetical protein
MQQDLAYLPAWSAEAKDYVFLEEELPDSFKNYISDNLNPIAQGITVAELGTKQIPCLVKPWGISPQVIHYFDTTNNQYRLNLEIARWNSALEHLSSRKNAQICLSELCSSIPQISPSIIPCFYENLSDIEQLVEAKDYQLLAKAPYSSSGRGLLWLPIGELTRTERQILHGMLKKQTCVSVEKALDKQLDFAMEFLISDQSTSSFEGYSLFDTNKKGAYLGNYIGSQSSIESKISSYIDIRLLDMVKDKLKQILQSQFSSIYSGFIGVDMLIYKEGDAYKLNPCVEINVRNNMGLTAIAISKHYIAPDKEGRFYIDFSATEGELKQLDKQMKEEYPATFYDGKMQSGYLSLCPVTTNSRYRAYIIIKN